MRKLAVIACWSLLLAECLVNATRADEFPVRSIRIVVPFPAGGTTDILARSVAQALGERLGVATFVENRAGASGTIGSELVAKSPADGSVLLLTATHHVINPSLFRKLPYDTRKDFSPIAVVATAPNALFVNKDFPAKTVAELVAMAKKDPGKLSFGSTGIGGANHLSGEMFKQMAGIDLVHIPYKGAAPAMNDLLGGHIPIMFDTLTTVLPEATAGNIRVLAVTSLTRAASLPDVPTMDQAGVKGFESIAWFGLYMPAANNNAAYTKLAAAMRDILASAAIKQKFATQGVDPGELFGAEFASFIDAEIGKWGAVVKAANVQQQE
jgi:tripartite-type tricarboxylate transporter receptor subunit TctC